MGHWERAHDMDWGIHLVVDLVVVRAVATRIGTTPPALLGVSFAYHINTYTHTHDVSRSPKKTRLLDKQLEPVGA